MACACHPQPGKDDGCSGGLASMGLSCTCTCTSTSSEIERQVMAVHAPKLCFHVNAQWLPRIKLRHVIRVLQLSKLLLHLKLCHGGRMELQEPEGALQFFSKGGASSQGKQ